MPTNRITWKTEYDIGVPAIDQQHRQLFAMLDNLTKPDADIRLGALALSLGHYIDEHFGFEEQLMRKHGYPHMAGHVAQHTALKEQYRTMTAGVNADDEQAIAKARMVVYAWFTRHILGDEMDRKLGAFLGRIGLFLR